tara:strand:- start:226 stop:447 length:222 start_codon:yes stop_codon:yes gene_type:complete
LNSSELKYYNINRTSKMIRPMIKTLPEVKELKKILRDNFILVDSFLSAELLSGPSESVELILNIKKLLEDNDD